MLPNTRGLVPALALAVTLAVDALAAERPSPVADRASPTPVGGVDGASLIGGRLPRVVYRGGPFVRHPRIVTITFAGDDPAVVASLARFADTITRTSWWRAVSGGYCAAPGDCIGDGRAGRAVQLDETLPATVRANDVEALLVRAAKAGQLGEIDAETLLLTYLPAGVDLGDAFNPRYCQSGARAMHRALRLPDVTLPFAVLPRCVTLDELTATASHEIVEATTNSDPARPGFAFERAPEAAAFTAAGTEPVDPCGLVTMDRHRAVADGFTVQRAWSNDAAAQGHDPCVPSPADQPYLALIPEKPVVRLPAVGDSVTITVEGAADRTVSAWNVSAIDLSGKQDGGRYLDVALDGATVAPGQTLRLTITARQLHPKGRALVALVSTRGGGTYVWPLAVMMR